MVLSGQSLLILCTVLGPELCIQGLLQEAFQFQEG